MLILDGKIVRDEIRESLREKVASLSFVPILEIIDVGGYKETFAYVNQKKIFGESIGVSVNHKIFSESTAEEEIISYIEEANKKEEVLGIIVQLPLPEPYDEQRVLDVVLPQKDIDGLTTTNVEMLYGGGDPYFVPATARGTMELLDYYSVSYVGKAVVIGASNLTGRPIGELLKRKGMEVAVCDSETKNIEELSREANILVSATGVPHLVNKNFVKEGQVIIDVGYALKEIDGAMKVFGDVDFEDVKNIVGAITPVPGGIGPMTVAGLFKNLLNTPFRL